MDVRFSRRIERATRVREFCKAHPLPDPAYATALAALEEAIARAQAIADRQHQGLAAARAARGRRRQLRKDLHTQILKYLVAVGDLIAAERPELAEKLGLPRSDLSYRSFVTAVRGMLASATPEKELLVKKGMSETLLDDLGRMVDAMEAAGETARTSRREHIGARADFDVVSFELAKEIGVLEGLYRYRFGADAELMAEWDAVRQIPGLPQPKAEEKTPPDSGGGSPKAA